MLLGLGRAGQRQRVVIGDAVADDAAVGRERGDRGRARRRRVDGDAQRARGHPGIAGGIGRRGGQAVAAIRQGRRGVAPGPAAARHRAAEQRRAVIDLDRAVGLRRAGQRQRVVIGDAVADDAAVGRERGDRRRSRRRRVDGDRQRARGHAGIAGGIGRRRRQAVAAIGEGRGGVAPGARAARHRAAEQRRAVIDLDRAVGLGRAGQRQRVVIGDAVADDAAVGRERGDGRRARRRRVDGDVQRARGHAGVAGGIGCRRRQAVAAIRQDRRGVAPGPGAVRHRAAEQRRTVIDLDRAVGLRRAGQRQRVVIGDAVADDAAVGRERGDGRRSRRVVSMVTLSALEATPVLPAASVAVAVRLWPPFGRTAVV